MTAAGPRVIGVVGASGVGKDTLMQAAADACPGIALLRRVITRPAQAGGEDFEGVTPDEFAARRAAGAFALDWQAHGLSYGIPRRLPDAPVVLVNLSRRVLNQAAAAFPGLRVVHVTAPPAVLAQRLAARGREDAGAIAARLSREAPLAPCGADIVTIDNSGPLPDGAAAFLAAIGPLP